MKKDAHPSREELVAWLTGAMNADCVQAMETHVDHCSACLTELESIVQSCNSMQRQVRSACQATIDSDEAPVVNLQELEPTIDSEIDMEGETIDLAGVSSDDAVSEFANPGFDRYNVLSVIARGGMGEVRLAKDNAVRRLVAMKVIRSESKRETRTGRFIEEAQITGQLEHPGIVPVHEIGIAEDGSYYYTMKRIQGRSLSEIIKAIREGDEEVQNGFPLSRLLDIFSRVCDAMEFAHSKHVIHRDLKPDNVMVGQYGEVLVVDCRVFVDCEFDALQQLLECRKTASRSVGNRSETSRAVGVQGRTSRPQGGANSNRGKSSHRDRFRKVANLAGRSSVP